MVSLFHVEKDMDSNRLFAVYDFQDDVINLQALSRLQRDKQWGIQEFLLYCNFISFASSKRRTMGNSGISVILKFYFIIHEKRNNGEFVIVCSSCYHIVYLTCFSSCFLG